jgi:hypothetical protein
MRTLLAIGLLSLSSVAVAQEEFDPDWYAGAGIGNLALETNNGFDFDGDDTTWQVLLGYRLLPYLGVEGAFLAGGEVRDEVNGAPVTIKSTAFQGSLIGSIPFSEMFAVHARVGAIRWDVGGDGIRFSDDTGADFIWGGGASLRLQDTVFRLEYQQADIESFDAEFVALSVMILI